MALPTRNWVSLRPSASSNPSFTLLSYNILSKNYALPSLYKSASEEVLDWDNRKKKIIQQLREHDADIVCLQEVDNDDFPSIFDGVQDLDYAHVYYKKLVDQSVASIDGCAVLFKKSTFGLLDHKVLHFVDLAAKREDLKATPESYERLTAGSIGPGYKRNLSVVTLLEHQSTHTRIIVVNPHLFWNPQLCDVKLVQAALLLDELKSIHAEYTKAWSSSNDIPLIICGDFNSLPGSGVDDLFTKGFCPKDHPDYQGFSYGSYTKEGAEHKFNLGSTHEGKGALPFTNYTEGFKGVIDYQYVTRKSLVATEILGEINPEYLEELPYKGFPNKELPSDHILLLSKLELQV